MVDIAAQFGGPIPGQSLTKEPGAAPWEKPPQFVDIDDAMQFVFERVTEPRAAHKLLALMEAGVPVTSIVETILKTGFMEGKWTPDLMLLMIKPLAAVLIKIAQMYEVEFVSGAEDEDEVEEEFIRLADAKAFSAPTNGAPEDARPDLSDIPTGGLMSPKGV